MRKITGAIVIGGSLIILILWIAHLLYPVFFRNQGDLSLQEEKSELINERTSPGHVLVSSRSIVDGYGVLAKDREVDHWRTKETQEYAYDQIGPETQFVVIFIHGYNVPVTNAIKFGERLKSFACEQNADPCPEAVLYSYLWRGDLGREEFRAAQKAATTSARPFATFLTELRHRNPDLPIVLVSHSLGARVLLEGLLMLRDSEQKQWVDLAVLIQPAIRVSDISKWKEGGLLCTIRVWWWCIDQGRYWGAFDASGHMLATVSDGDRVLQAAFPMGKELSSEPFATALGADTDFNLPSGKVDAFVGKDGIVFKSFYDRESPIEVIEISSMRHSEIFEDEHDSEDKLLVLWDRVRSHIEALQVSRD